MGQGRARGRREGHREHVEYVHASQQAGRQAGRLGCMHALALHPPPAATASCHRLLPPPARPACLPWHRWAASLRSAPRSSGGRSRRSRCWTSACWRWRGMSPRATRGWPSGAALLPAAAGCLLAGCFVLLCRMEAGLELGRQYVARGCLLPACLPLLMCLPPPQPPPLAQAVPPREPAAGHRGVCGL